jgi:DNA mismatch repair protein MutL
LSDLSTFGFRGEALSAIASVTEMIMVSRSREQEAATRLYLRGGTLLEKKHTSAPVGTEIEVRNLFFNVPARRKFLKSPISEERKIVELLENFLISFPKIHFRIEKDNEMLYEVPDQSLKERLPSLFRGIPEEDWEYYEEEFQGLCASVYVAKMTYHRKNRTAIRTFVNGRIVKNPIFFASIDTAFEQFFSKKQFPFLVLFLTTPTDFVDVNVHPQKLDVQFARSEWVFHLLQKTFQNLTRRFFPEIKIENRPEGEREGTHFQPPLPRTISSTEAVVSSRTSPSFFERKNDRDGVFIENIERLPFAKPTETDEKTFGNQNFTITGIIAKRYVVGEDEAGVFFIDFHAAHERLLFDQISENNGTISSQTLLDPLPISLNSLQISTVKEHEAKLVQFGFRFENSSRRFMLTGIPVKIDINEAESVFFDVIDGLRLSEIEPLPEVYRRIFASIACKQAFRTGDAFTMENAFHLLSEMQRKNIQTCPHGRPVKFRLPFKELDNYFKR